MVVRLRLARHGTKNNPFYHVVAIRDKASRDARPIEKLGEYDPIPRPRIISGAASSSASTSERVMSSGLEAKVTVMEKRIEWNADRIKYWIDVGAQPSKPVARLLDRVSGRHCLLVCF
jgi:small subunit ribosomal protein S16